MTRIEDHVLYYFADCPFYINVRNFLEENDLSIEGHDMDEEVEARNFVTIKTGDFAQSPALYIKNENKILLESEDIIAYLKENFVH